MRRAAVAAFAVGALLGAATVWLLPVPGSDTPGRRNSDAPTPPSSISTEPPPPARVPDADREAPSASVERTADLEGRVAELEAALSAARAEARTNRLKGALVLTIDFRTPEDLLKPYLDIEPDPGVERLAQRPEMVTSTPFMFLHTIVAEDFEEALQRTLDHQLRWTEEWDLDAEETKAIRAFTERAYRTMDGLQRRQRTLRRRLTDPGALSAEEKKSLETRLAELGDLDHRVYMRSSEPLLRVPHLVPRRARGE